MTMSEFGMLAILGIAGAIMGSYRYAYRLGWRHAVQAGSIELSDPQVTIQVVTKNVKFPREKVVPAEKPAQSAEPIPLMTQDAVAKALGKEINKGRKADPEEVERLVALNNSYRQQQRKA